jgi:hypothetical protein
MSQAHRIRRQSWQVAAPDAATAFAVRALLRGEQESSLLLALERAFDALDVGDRELHLSRLHIKLDFAGTGQMTDDLPERLFAATALALQQALQGDEKASTNEQLREYGPAERLRHYLASGQLAWFDANRDRREIIAALAAEAALWTQAPAVNWPRLLAVPAAAGHGLADVLFRFLQLLDDSQRRVWADFAAGLAGSAEGKLSQAIAGLARLQAAQPLDRQLRLQALGLLLVAGASRPALAAEGQSALVALQPSPGEMADQERPVWQMIEGLVLGLTATPFPTPTMVDNAPPSIATVNPENWPIFPVDRAPSEETLGRNTKPGLPVQACGLVLLHPYLPRLFAGLGWIAADHPFGTALPAAILPTAAALLHWLASGDDNPHEFELGLIKLLLGLAPDEPLPVAGGLLGVAEKEEGEALLAAVIAHWSALGQSSINGLRVSFLQRGGLLYPAADGWLLQPQAEAYDVLLDRLPWGISIIRLPWMRRSLHSQWHSS